MGWWSGCPLRWYSGVVVMVPPEVAQCGGGHGALRWHSVHVVGVMVP